MMYLLQVSRNDFIYENVGVFSTENLAQDYVENHYTILNSDMSTNLDDESLIECYTIERISFIQ